VRRARFTQGLGTAANDSAAGEARSWARSFVNATYRNPLAWRPAGRDLGGRLIDDALPAGRREGVFVPGAVSDRGRSLAW